MWNFCCDTLKMVFNSEMDKFFYDLENVLERYNQDVTALDDYEVLCLFFFS